MSFDPVCVIHTPANVGLFWGLPVPIWSAIVTLMASLTATWLALRASKRVDQMQLRESQAAARRVIITFERGETGQPAVWRVTNHDTSPILEVLVVEAWGQKTGARQVGAGVLASGESAVVKPFDMHVQPPNYCYSDRQEDILLIEFRDVRGQAWQRLGHCEPKAVEGFWNLSREKQSDYYPSQQTPGQEE